MPQIVFEGPCLEKGQKAKLVKEFTDTAAEVTGIPKQAFVVLIKENTPENVGVGGELLADR